MLRVAWVFAALAYLEGAAITVALLAALARARGRWRLRVAYGWLPALVLAAGLGALERERGAPVLVHGATSVRAVVVLLERSVQRGTRSSTWARIEALACTDSLASDTRRRRSRAWRGRRVRLLARDALPGYGARMLVVGHLRAPRPQRNFSAFDERRFMRARGADAVLVAADVTRLPGAGGLTWRRHAIEPLRAWLRARLHDTLAPREAGLLAALVLGLRDGLDERVAESWRALGMSHVLALSGLHVGLVAGALLAIVGTPRRRAGLLVFVGGVATYAALGGLGPSVVRAASMAAWMACAVHVGRAHAPMAALATAAVLMLLDAPRVGMDLRFQLSCLATLGILVWLPTAGSQGARDGGRLRRTVRGLRALTGVGLAAQAATLPIVVTHFGLLSWAAPLANLTLVPVVGLALLLALAGLPCVAVAESLARSLWLTAGALLHGVLRITDGVPERLDPRVFLGATPVEQLAAWAFCIAVLTAGVATRQGSRRARRAACAVATLAVLVLLLHMARPRLPSWEAVALDVGQGDALLVRLGRHAWLIDAGHDRPIDHGARTIVPYLRRQGIRRLHGLVLTHPHRDHYGGAASVLQEMRVDTVYVAEASLQTAAFVTLRDATPVPWRGLAAGAQLRLAPHYEARVLWPPPHDVLESGANGVSLVLWARGADRPTLLAMGDLEADGEEALLQAYADTLRAHTETDLVLKVGHHGSRTSSIPELLDAIDAEIALISVGEGNRYAHPAPQTLHSLEARDCVVLRTDRGGAIRLVQRARTLWIERPSRAARAWVGAVEAARGGPDRATPSVSDASGIPRRRLDREALTPLQATP